MTAIVEVFELERYMNTSFDSSASIEAGEIISSVQSELEAKLGRPVSVREFTDTVPVARDGSWNVYLPQSPVVEISAIAVDGDPQVFDGQVVKSWGVQEYSGAIGTLGTIVVTYTAGIDGTTPEHSVLKLAIKRAAAREMVQRADATQGSSRLSDEGYSVDYVQPDGFFTAAELNGLARYKRRRMSG